MKSCWIIYNGSLTSDKFADQARLVGEAAIRAGVEVLLLRNNEIPIDLQEPIHNPPDFVVFLDKDILLASYLKQMGIPIFNDPEVIETCDNKAKQYLELAKHGIAMPRTIIAPKVYPNFTIRDSGYYEIVLEQLGLPMIIKEGHGSFGMKVYLIETEDAFYEKTDELRGVDYVFQKFISSSRGRDLRVNIVGDDIVAAMYRHSETDFRANITNGGTAEVVELTAEQKQLALRAAKAVGAEFAGVDLLYGPNEEPLVCEVNAAAHIRNIYNVTGINVADAMVSYVLRKLA
ncbi:MULTISPECIES: RimK family alpha-L-glutamate ligase [unclassified Sporosarcina]|uniref:ATP-grasp domain-containing protein n=1 Tax=unclassified Sporosarcina TaxID=2647733 RepID=UPI0020420EB6|nr:MULTISPECIES: RimK family alpha-L-glutamate ligase [unclassified Sporosarcina]GKV66543.1 RimK family alpha-L-glutamate ligase [Sporosarcina sp. NCCP-2331]GLB56820.1 RimK family alpha-L-glutamate ligase [Sporosarcina sp. NCCP-2378]